MSWKKRIFGENTWLRINPSEIETALLQGESIQEAVVVARESPAGEQRLVAYVVPSSPYAPTVTDMRRSLAKTLPDYMIPTAFIMLEAFPRTPTGKVDRRALPVPDNSIIEQNATYVAPRTPEKVSHKSGLRSYLLIK
jgi:acyl-coenzyme A synthetase/AMP-(fatty) acid ligase